MIVYKNSIHIDSLPYIIKVDRTYVDSVIYDRGIDTLHSLWTPPYLLEGCQSN